MSKTIYYIGINLKTKDGFESIGKFFVGNKKESAGSIFSKLKGRTQVNDKEFLTLELIETKDELPLNIQVISCSLEELTENCRLIAKEIFNLFNLEKT